MYIHVCMYVCTLTIVSVEVSCTSTIDSHILVAILYLNSNN